MLGAVLAPVRGDHPDQAAILDERVRDLGLDQHLAPAVLDRGRQGEQQQAGVHRRLSRGVHARRAGGSQAGLQVPAGARAQPLHAEVERVHQLEAAPQSLGLVTIERDVEGAAGRVADLQLAVRGELVREAGPGSGRGQAEAHQRLLAPARFANRGQHSRGDMGGSVARVVALEHAHPQAAPRRPPRAGQPQRPAAHHDRVQRLRLAVSRARSLQRHDHVVVFFGGL